jgi:hypothetical protein
MFSLSFFPKKIEKPQIKERIIPLNLYQTWYTLQLPPNMKTNVESLKAQNPEFKHYLYDDTMCRNFIAENFDADVLYAFDKLKPGAYKADLWRYCILYKQGGIYLDIKYNCVNHFKLIQLTDQEYCVRDRPYTGIVGIYNALLCFKPNNTILHKCIETIVKFVKYNVTGYTSLHLTGPHLMCTFFTKQEIYNLPLSFNGDSICLNNIPILTIYTTYRKEQENTGIKHYEKLWTEKDIYHYPTLTPITLDNPDKIDEPLILNWFPIEIKKENSIEIKPTPIYFKSTTEISRDRIDSNIWFLLYKCNKHFFAVFDETMNLLRYSELVDIKKDSKLHEYSMESIKALKWYTN